MNLVKASCACLLLTGTLALGAGTATAAPFSAPLGLVAATPAAGIEQVGWVCGPWRCWWRPAPVGVRPWGGDWGLCPPGYALGPYGHMCWRR